MRLMGYDPNFIAKRAMPKPKVNPYATLRQSNL